MLQVDAPRSYGIAANVAEVLVENGTTLSVVFEADFPIWSM